MRAFIGNHGPEQTLLHSCADAGSRILYINLQVILFFFHTDDDIPSAHLLLGINGVGKKIVQYLHQIIDITADSIGAILFRFRYYPAAAAHQLMSHEKHTSFYQLFCSKRCINIGIHIGRLSFYGRNDIRHIGGRFPDLFKPLLHFLKNFPVIVSGHIGIFQAVPAFLNQIFHR